MKVVIAVLCIFLVSNEAFAWGVVLGFLLGLDWD